eukprot:GHVH01008715.1.p1 GENE.GHVH01008715.1~~GHVH01008715.1.p1  ORF type:complete len:357 (-),score=39.91 GHVH01008715.1:256-1326(-)
MKCINRVVKWSLGLLSSVAVAFKQEFYTGNENKIIVIEIDKMLKNQVAVVTGSGQGLGFVYAKALAKAGANVVVNDINKEAADKAVSAIKNQGGNAIANYSDCTEGEAIIKTAIAHFGRIDILINNAGIIRDSSFSKMDMAQFDAVIRTHLMGSAYCSKAAWNHMVSQKYGRIINVSSGSGLYGNFGQANYSTAKSGLVGLTKTLSHEGKSKNIHVNVIAPLAGTPMTKDVFPKDVYDALTPESISGFIVYLAGPDADTGKIFEAAGGVFAEVRYSRADGITLSSEPKADDIKKNMDKICDFSAATFPESLMDSTQWVIKKLDERQEVVDSSEIKINDMWLCKKYLERMQAWLSKN